MFSAELTDKSGASLGMVEQGQLSVERKLCGGLNCSFEVLGSDPNAHNVLCNGDRAVRIWEDGYLHFNGKIRDPLVRSFGKLRVNASSPFVLLDRRQLQAAREFDNVDQGQIIAQILASENTRSPTHLRLATYALSLTRDRSYEMGKQVREIVEQMAGVIDGPWFVETPVDEGATYSALELRYPPPPTPITRTGTLTDDSPVVSGLSTTSDLVVGMSVSGVGIPPNRWIVEIIDGTSVRMSAKANLLGVKDCYATVGTNRLRFITDVLDLMVGMNVSGANIPAGAKISSIDWIGMDTGFYHGGDVYIDKNVTATGNIVPATFTAPASASLTFTPGPAEAGVDRPDIRFEFGEDTLANLSDYEVAEGLPLNGVTVAGAEYTTPGRAEDSASIASYDLYERWVSLSDVKFSDVLVGRAYEMLRPDPVRTFTVSIARTGAGLNAPPVPRVGHDFNVGDVVYLTIHDEVTRFDSVPTLVGQTTIKPSDEDTGVEQELVLGQLASADDGSMYATAAA